MIKLIYTALGKKKFYAGPITPLKMTYVTGEKWPM